MTFTSTTNRIRSLSLMCMLMFVVALGPLAGQPGVSARQATPAAGARPATPTVPANLGCTIWRTSGDSPTTPESCTWSAPWWESFASCPVIPVHSEPWTGSYPVQDALTAMSWFRVDMDDVTVTAFLFMGNRPLPVGTTFPDGSATKILWRFDQPVSDFAVTTTNTGDPSHTSIPAIDTGPANTAGDTSASWPSYLFVPAPGCWSFELSATTTAGKTVTGSFTYVAVP